MPESRKTDRDDVLLEDNVSGESEDGKDILMLTKIVINDGNGHANQYIDGNCVKTNKNLTRATSFLKSAGLYLGWTYFAWKRQK